MSDSSWVKPIYGITNGGYIFDDQLYEDRSDAVKEAERLQAVYGHLSPYGYHVKTFLLAPAASSKSTSVASKLLKCAGRWKAAMPC